MKRLLLSGSVIAVLVGCGAKTTFGSVSKTSTHATPKKESRVDSVADQAAKIGKTVPDSLVQVDPPALPVPTAVASDTGTSQPPPAAELSPAVEAVPTLVTCPLDFYNSISQLAAKRGGKVVLPTTDAPMGNKLVYTAAKPLPSGTSLEPGAFVVADTARSAASQAELKVAFADGNCEADMKIDVLADETLISTTVLSRGAKGTFYPLIKTGGHPLLTLPDGKRMPDFDKIAPMSRASIYVPALDLTCQQSADQSCPGNNGFIIEGYRDLKEYFGIRFENLLVIEEDGQYQFQSYSDDGSTMRLIEGPGLTAPVYAVLNGGDHSSSAQTGAPVTLKKGIYRMVTDFYQGPIGAFSLQIRWKKPGASTFVLVPSESLRVEEDK